MIDALISNLKDQVSGKLQKEAGVKSSQVDDIMDIVKSVAGKKVGNEILEGNFSKIANLFSDAPNTKEADSLQADLSSSILTQLTSKLNLSKDTASDVVKIVVPALVNIISKKKESGDEEDTSAIKKIFGENLGDAAKRKLGSFLR